MMTQLGKVEKPEAEQFKQIKKLYLVPLIYANEDATEEYKGKYSRYWQQVAEQLDNLESKAGKVHRVYHESISQSGDEGIQAVERLNPNSHQITKNKCEDGAVFEATEEHELLEEVMDWERFLMLGCISEKVAHKVSEFYIEATKKRNESITEKISQTLKDNEAGLLFIREGHMVQFPSDIEVFSVFPPALDEIQRWLRDHADRLGKEEAAKETKKEIKKKTRKKVKKESR